MTAENQVTDLEALFADLYELGKGQGDVVVPPAIAFKTNRRLKHEDEMLQRRGDDDQISATSNALSTAVDSWQALNQGIKQAKQTLPQNEQMALVPQKLREVSIRLRDAREDDNQQLVTRLETVRDGFKNAFIKNVTLEHTQPFSQALTALADVLPYKSESTTKQLLGRDGQPHREVKSNSSTSPWKVARAGLSQKQRIDNATQSTIGAAETTLAKLKDGEVLSIDKARSLFGQIRAGLEAMTGVHIPKVGEPHVDAVLKNRLVKLYDEQVELALAVANIGFDKADPLHVGRAKAIVDMHGQLLDRVSTDLYSLHADNVKPANDMIKRLKDHSNACRSVIRQKHVIPAITEKLGMMSEDEYQAELRQLETVRDQTAMMKLMEKAANPAAELEMNVEQVRELMVVADAYGINVSLKSDVRQGKALAELQTKAVGALVKELETELKKVRTPDEAMVVVQRQRSAGMLTTITGNDGKKQTVAANWIEPKLRAKIDAIKTGAYRAKGRLIKEARGKEESDMKALMSKEEVTVYPLDGRGYVAVQEGVSEKKLTPGWKIVASSTPDLRVGNFHIDSNRPDILKTAMKGEPFGDYDSWRAYRRGEQKREVVQATNVEEYKASLMTDVVKELGKDGDDPHRFESRIVARTDAKTGQKDWLVVVVENLGEAQEIEISRNDGDKVKVRVCPKIRVVRAVTVKKQKDKLTVAEFATKDGKFGAISASGLETGTVRQIANLKEPEAKALGLGKSWEHFTKKK